MFFNGLRCNGSTVSGGCLFKFPAEGRIPWRTASGCHPFKSLAEGRKPWRTLIDRSAAFVEVFGWPSYRGSLHSLFGSEFAWRKVSVHMDFACRVLFLLVPGKMIAELYSLLGCCVFLRQIHMHFAFRVLPVPVFTFRVFRFLTPDWYAFSV